MAPEISVIITCYNLERYIGAAIESVLAQDISEPVEILVVDDCSSDQSAAVVKSYPNVSYFRTEANAGVLLAMLDGMRRTSGQLVFLLDGDDLWEPSKLSRCVAAFRSNPGCALSTHDLSYIDELDRPLSRRSRPAEVLTALNADARSSKVIDGILQHRDFIWLGSALGVHRQRANLQGFDEWARQLPDPANTYQDWPLAYWIASTSGAQAAYVPEKLFKYRLHGANYSGDARTSARALRNLRRVKNTLEAMLALARRRRLPPEVAAILERRASSCEYLIDLYSGRRLAALTRFPRVLPDFFTRGEAGKEIVRFGAILLFGPDRFARIMGRRGRA